MGRDERRDGGARRAARSARPRGRSVRRRTGSTLVEAIVAGSVVAVGAVTALSVIVSALTLDRTNRETRMAFEAARAELEGLRAEPFDDIVRICNDDPDDDPGGRGTAKGKRFHVKGMKKKRGEPAGEFQLPLDASGLVREDAALPELGFPRDLNGDGAVDSANHGADMVILPLAVEIRWEGAQGERSISAATVIHR